MCLFTGCTKVSHISVEECQKESKPHIVGLVTTSGQEMRFRGGYCQLAGNSFVGVDTIGNSLLIQSDSVAAVEVKRLDKFGTVVLAVTIVSAITAIELLLIETAVHNPW